MQQTEPSSCGRYFQTIRQDIKRLNLYAIPDPKRVSLIALIFLFSIFSCATTGANELGIESKIRTIKIDYNVHVYHRYDARNYFPHRWLKAPISAIGKQLPAEEAARILPIIQEFLSTYPEQVIHKNLKSIYLLSELKFYGKSFGATNRRSSLYIKSQGVGKGFSDSFLISRMHSEFASILMRNHSFPNVRWNRVNPAGFRYVGNGRDVLDRQNLYGQSKKLLEDGFIVQYSESSIENDFNMISDWLFTRRDELRELAKKYPRIESKTHLAIRFYRSIDNSFTFD